MVWHNNILKQFKIVNPQTKNEDIFYGAYNTLLTELFLLREGYQVSLVV